MIIIAGDFGYADGGAATSRLFHVAAAFAHHGYHVKMLAMSGVRKASTLAQVTVPLEQKIELVGWTPPENPRPFGGRLGWFIATYWGTVACWRWLSVESGLSKGDVLYLYGRSVVRLAPLLRLARRRGAFVIVDSTEGIERFHGFGLRLSPIWWDWALGIRYLSRNADLVAAISSGLAERALVSGAKNVCVLPGIEQWPEAPSVLRPTDSRLRAVVFGALSTKDDPGLLLHVVRECVRLKLPVCFELVGRYAGSKEGNRWARRIQAAEQGETLVRLPGAPSTSELARILNTADVFVMLRPDVTAERLAFPTRLVELLRAGKPMIVSNVGDIPCYLQDGVSAFVVPAGDATAVVARLQQLIGNPEQGRLVGLEGFKQGKKFFDSNLVVKNLIDKIIADSPSGFSPRAPA